MPNETEKEYSWFQHFEGLKVMPILKTGKWGPMPTLLLVLCYLETSEIDKRLLEPNLFLNGGRVCLMSSAVYTYYTHFRFHCD